MAVRYVKVFGRTVPVDVDSEYWKDWPDADDGDAGPTAGDREPRRPRPDSGAAANSLPFAEERG